MRQNILAAALSSVLPGAVQLYNRQWLKGGAFLIAVMVLSAVIRRRLLLAEPSLMALLLAASLLAIAIWSVVDAYRSAKMT